MAKLDILLQGYPMRTTVAVMGLCNVVLVETEDGRKILFDCGYFNHRLHLLEALKKRDLSMGDIDYVVLSHLHFDHCQNASLFPKSRIIVCKAELDYAANLLKNGYNPYGPDPWIFEYYQEMLAKCKVETMDDQLTIADDFRLIRAPGHTQGIVYAIVNVKDEKWVLSSDVAKDGMDFLAKKPLLFDPTPENIRLAGKAIDDILNIADYIVPGHERIFKVVGKQITWDTMLDFTIQIY